MRPIKKVLRMVENGFHFAFPELLDQKSLLKSVKRLTVEQPELLWIWAGVIHREFRLGIQPENILVKRPPTAA